MIGGRVRGAWMRLSPSVISVARISLALGCAHHSATEREHVDAGPTLPASCFSQRRCICGSIAIAFRVWMAVTLSTRKA